MTTIIERENAYTSGVYGKRPVAVVRGQGALVWDAEGRAYIDCTAGYGVANIGHARPEIAAALAAQAQRLISCPELFYNDMRANLLERLAQLTPEGLDHIFLCNSGTEAIEGALKFARLATGRTGIVATLRGFHGRTMGALSATWEPHYREPFTPLIPGVTHIRYNDLTMAEAAINEDTAAVLIELVQGEGGVHVARDEYVQSLARLCQERGALLIIDEVQTGFGRTGRLFACQHYNLQPDILCLAKSLAGGVPMGAICLGPRVMESGRITRGVHGSSFGGNPLACAAALATLDIIEQEALPERAAHLGTFALQRLRSLRSPLIREVRGRGLLLGIELTRRVQPYLEALAERGVLALQAGPNVLRLLPPLVITEEQLAQVIEVIAEVLGATQIETAYERGEHTGESIHSSIQSQIRQGSAALALAPAPLTTSMESSHQDEVALLQRMLTIPSYSGQEQALAHFLVEQARQMGLHAFVDDAGNFIASTNNIYPLSQRTGKGTARTEKGTEGTRKGMPLQVPQSVEASPCGCLPGDLTMIQGDLTTIQKEDTSIAQPVIMLGHMDTVRGYIPVRLEDGRLYGRGAVDAKGPLAAFLCATARLAHENAFRHPLLVIGAVEEEAATSRGARAVVERYSPLACIIGEPSGSEAVTIGYKGRLLVEYTLAHPISHSAGPQQNSSELAINFWNRVQQHALEWNECHAANSPFASLMPSLREVNSSQDGFEERTRLFIGYRLPPDFDVAGLREQLERWASEDGARLTFSGEEYAFQTTRTTPLARAFIQAIRATGRQSSFKVKTGTSDMNVVGPIWGQNIVAYGPGDSRLDHTPQEHISIAEYLHAIDVLERVLRELAMQGEGRS